MVRGRNGFGTAGRSVPVRCSRGHPTVLDHGVPAMRLSGHSYSVHGHSGNATGKRHSFIRGHRASVRGPLHAVLTISRAPAPRTTAVMAVRASLTSVALFAPGGRRSLRSYVPIMTATRPARRGLLRRRPVWLIRSDPTATATPLPASARSRSRTSCSIAALRALQLRPRSASTPFRQAGAITPPVRLPRQPASAESPRRHDLTAQAARARPSTSRSARSRPPRADPGPDARGSDQPADRSPDAGSDRSPDAGSDPDAPTHGSDRSSDAGSDAEAPTQAPTAPPTAQSRSRRSAPSAVVPSRSQLASANVDDVLSTPGDVVINADGTYPEPGDYSAVGRVGGDVVTDAGPFTSRPPDRGSDGSHHGASILIAKLDNNGTADPRMTSSWTAPPSRSTSTTATRLRRRRRARLRPRRDLDGMLDTDQLEAGWYWIVEAVVPAGLHRQRPDPRRAQHRSSVTCLWDAPG